MTGDLEDDGVMSFIVALLVHVLTVLCASPNGFLVTLAFWSRLPCTFIGAVLKHALAFNSKFVLIGMKLLVLSDCANSAGLGQ